MMDGLSHAKLRLPWWLAFLYLLVAIGLIPWIVVLYSSLPLRHLSHHWNLAWVGFDIGMFIAIGLTAFLTAKKSGWVCLTSMSVFTFLLIDAWFDVLTARPGRQSLEAILLAALVELPLAAVSLWLSYRVANQLISPGAVPR
jgi:hypothetical protein